MLNSEAIRYLQRDELLHVDMLEALRRGEADVVQAGEDGVLLYHRGGEVYLLSRCRETAVPRLAEKIPGGAAIVAHSESTAQALKKLRSFEEELPCWQVSYRREKAPGFGASGVEFRPLGEEWLPFVFSRYSLGADEEYLRGRLRSGSVFGAFLKGEPVGFAGYHAEGSLGMLEVFPEYRRRGIARDLEAYLIFRQLERGYTPYGNVVVGNLESRALQESLGLTVAGDHINWLS